MQLVLVSCLVAFPLAGSIMHRSLQGYAYRIHIECWVFVAACAAAATVAVVAVGTHAIRAAIANPVKSLRTE